MANIRFGLYLIPQGGELYRIGSAITGYDIRAEKEVSPPEWLNPQWRGSASTYGFHTTITDAIYLEEAKLPSIISETRQQLRCFKPSNNYVLTKESAGFWAPDRNDAVVLLSPNRNIEMLHDVLVTAIHPLGDGSEYTDALRHDPSSLFPDDPVRISKTEVYFGPYIFEDFRPHFTLFTEFSGTPEERKQVEHDLVSACAPLETLAFNSLALVVQKAGEPHFKIVEEFDLHAAR